MFLYTQQRRYIRRNLWYRKIQYCTQIGALKRITFGDEEIYYTTLLVYGLYIYIYISSNISKRTIILFVSWTFVLVLNKTNILQQQNTHIDIKKTFVKSTCQFPGRQNKILFNRIFSMRTFFILVATGILFRQFENTMTNHFEVVKYRKREVVNTRYFEMEFYRYFEREITVYQRSIIGKKGIIVS